MLVNKYFANLTGKKPDNSQDAEYEIFRALFLEHVHIGRFSNLH